VKWSYVNTTETSLYISVIPNTRYYVRIRAFDAEGYKSSWTSTQSIVSAKDITSPSTPSGLVVEALFQKIVLKWNPNTEKDFEKYKVQVSKDNFTTVEETLYTSSNYLVYGGDTDTKYYFRVSAIDTSGNESNFSAIVNATTAKVYDEDLESEILNGLADDLEELNTVTLPNLQSELDSKLDDLPGEIKETHIADNSISTAKIKANAVTANEINAGAVTSSKIAANAITSNHIGANQIITNTANIATGIIDTVHIKDAAIKEAKIADAAITNAKIANAAIDDAKIANLDASKITSGYIDAERIAADSITVSKLVAKPSFAIPEGAIAYFTDSLVDNVSGITPEGYDEINLSPRITLMPENAPEGSIIAPLMVADKIYADHIASNAITSDKILANAVTSAKIAASAITAEKIGTNQIITNSANIATGVIETAHIKDAAISTAKIANAAITNAKIGNLAVDDAKIANVNAAKINAGYISADRIASNSITSAKIAAGAITAEKVASNAITADKIAANSITSAKIAAGAVTADKIASNFTISAGQYIQAGTADRNYKLDGTQGLIRTIGSNVYNIFSYVTDGFVLFEGSEYMHMLSISLNDFGLTDYIVLLDTSTIRNYLSAGAYYLVLTWEKAANNYFNIIYYAFNDYASIGWGGLNGVFPNDLNGGWSIWNTIGDNTVERIQATIRVEFPNVRTQDTIHDYRVQHAYTIKVRTRADALSSTQLVYSWEVDWGDGLITEHYTFLSYEEWNLFTEVYVRPSSVLYHSGITGIKGTIAYTVLGY